MLSYRIGLIRAMNAVSSPGYVQPKPTRAEGCSPIGSFVNDFVFTDRGRRGRISDRDGICLEFLPLHPYDQLMILRVDLNRIKTFFRHYRQ
ncbi:hypothetical protein D3C77_606260 [compost metagenome]